MGPGDGSYYTTEVKSIYDTVVSELSADPDLRFNIAEVGFIRMWYEDEATSDAQRAAFTTLLKTK